MSQRNKNVSWSLVLEEGGCDRGRGYSPSGMNESSLLTRGTYGDHACVRSCCALTDSRFQVNRRETRDEQVNRHWAHWLRLIGSVFPLTPHHPSTGCTAQKQPKNTPICTSRLMCRALFFTTNLLLRLFQHIFQSKIHLDLIILTWSTVQGSLWAS